MAVAHHDFIPAAGRRWLLPLYDPMIALLTRERRWRGEILKSLDLEPGDIVVDVGCGTGTLAIMAKEQVPQARRSSASIPILTPWGARRRRRLAGNRRHLLSRIRQRDRETHRRRARDKAGVLACLPPYAARDAGRDAGFHACGAGARRSVADRGFRRRTFRRTRRRNVGR